MLEVNTFIPTPTGGKKLDKLQPGDLVYSKTGEQVKVLEVSQRSTCEVFTLKHFEQEFQTTGDQKWFCVGDIGNLTTKEFHQSGYNSLGIVIAEPVKNDKIRFIVDPYVFGLSLFCRERDNLLAVWNDKVDDQIHAAGYMTRPIAGGLVEISVEKESAKILLSDSYIIPDYLNSSEDDRVAVLEGIVDSFCGGTVRTKQGKKTLINDIIYLASSCAIRAILSKNKHNNLDFICFSSKRSLSRTGPTSYAVKPHKGLYRQIKINRKTEEAMCRSVKVEGDGTMLITRRFLVSVAS